MNEDGPPELTRGRALELIGDNIEHWLRYTRESFEREGKEVPLDCHVIPPVWPSYSQLENWLKYLRPASEDGWQPIETAPKDDMPIIAAFRDPSMGAWVVLSEVRWHVDHWCSDSDGVIVPTHWMPLPTPPQDTGRS